MPSVPNFGRTFASDSLHWLAMEETVRGHRTLGGLPLAKSASCRKPIKATLVDCQIGVMNI